jgi:hypothetical protein
MATIDEELRPKGFKPGTKIEPYVNWRSPNPAPAPEIKAIGYNPATLSRTGREVALTQRPNFVMGQTPQQAAARAAEKSEFANYKPPKVDPKTGLYTDPKVTGRTVAQSPLTPKPNVAQAAASKARGFTSAVSRAPISRGLAGAGTALGVGMEGVKAYQAATAPDATGLDVAEQVAESTGRLAGGALGAKAGAALGALGGPLAPLTVPAGAIIGGIAGYTGAGKLASLGRRAAGVDEREAVDRLVPMDDATGSVKAGSPQAQDPNRGQPTPTAPTALEKSIPITSPDLNGKPPGENPAGEVVNSAKQIAPGVFKQGRGQYSDSAEGMGFAPGFTGRPNAQNMAAAEALAQRSAARGFQPQPMQQQVEQPRLSGSGFGILDRDYQERRAAMMDAGQLKPGARTALRAVLQQQAQRPGMELERDKMAAGERAGAADRDMRQQELTARMGDAEATRALRAQEVGDNMATNAVRREAAGFEVESARQLQGLRQQFMAAKTDKERSEIAAKIQALQGKAQEQANRFTVVPGGQEIQMVGGFPTPVTRPSMVLNNQTGQFVGQEGMGMQQALPPITQNPKAMEIKNDPSMTVEQKRAALIALGYQ